jgi:hypothetical protein
MMLYLLAEIAASDGAAFMVDEFSREHCKRETPIRTPI